MSALLLCHCTLLLPLLRMPSHVHAQSPERTLMNVGLVHGVYAHAMNALFLHPRTVLSSGSGVTSSQVRIWRKQRTQGEILTWMRRPSSALQGNKCAPK